MKKIPIDRRSLLNYINWEYDLYLQYQRANNTNQRQESHYRLRYAQNILSLAEINQGSLPVTEFKSQFGRTYHQGINLQSCPSVVRIAALGRCYCADVDASALTWKYQMARKIDPQLRAPYTIDYFDYKNYHRQQLSYRVFGTDKYISLVKQIFSAVGFGATINRSGWINIGTKENPSFRPSTALTDIIRDKQTRKRLLDDPWFQNFTQEQTVISNIIYNEVKNLPALRKDMFRTPSGRISQNRVLAFLYQQSETEFMKPVIDWAQQSELLLVCHDAVYTRYRPDIASLQYLLTLNLPNSSMSLEAHTRFQSKEDIQELERHKNFIQEEEYRAAREHNRPIHRPKPLKFPYEQRNEEYDSGYDDGHSAYLEPRYNEYNEDLDQFVPEPLPDYILQLLDTAQNQI
jgi:hypothetical protein